MAKLVAAWSKDYLRGLIITLVASAIVLPVVCGCMLMSVTLANSAGPNDTP